MKRFLLTSLLAVIAAQFLSGCKSVGVDYFAPKTNVPDAWTVGLERQLAGGGASLQTWWRSFDDPVLNELIERTCRENPDFKIAAQAISEARARRGIAESALFPNAALGVEYARNRASNNSLRFPLSSNPSDLYTAGFDTSWELDFFGGLKRSVEAADAALDASVENYRDLLVTLFAETARNYVEYRTLEERLVVAARNIENQRDSVDLAQSRLDAGLGSQIDLSQAKSNLETTRAQVPQLRTQLAAARNRIATLTGGYPNSVQSLLSQGRPIPVPRAGASSGTPCDLIRSRPDIRRAERELAAATAQIGVAESDLYPKFNLFGQFNLQSLQANNFMDANSIGYSFGPSMSWQIFSAGRIRNSVRIEEANTEAALAAYEKTVLLAVEEVENSMAGIANERDRLEALRRAVAASNEAVGLVKENFKGGLVDFQRVIDTERTKFTNEDQAAVSKGQIATYYISLYKALGGGSQIDLIPVKEPQVKTRGFMMGKREKELLPYTMNNGVTVKPIPTATAKPKE